MKTWNMYEDEDRVAPVVDIDALGDRPREISLQGETALN